jgi:tol-pal system protein YbgF
MAASTRRALATAASALVLVGAPHAWAQDAPWTAQPAAPEKAGAPEKAAAGAKSQRPPGAKAGTEGEGAAAGAESGDAKLRQRVEHLEEQLVDMQVVIGTLETLARGGGAKAPDAGGPGSGGAGTGDQARLEGMETQIRALTAQVEQLSNEVRAQSGLPKRSDAGAMSPDGSPPDAPSAATGSGPSRFGSTTVTSGSADPIGDLAAGGANRTGGAPLPPAAAPAAQPSPQVAVASPEAAGAGNPKQLYEAAYGYLLQQDYSAAQAGFSDFLKRYPKDSLAPNALYWLGETHYVQRNFADAAEAFDLVTTSFGSSGKAADAQLKRGMALAQLGKKKDACAAFRDVGSKFPNAPAVVKSKAESERQRAACP